MTAHERGIDPPQITLIGHPFAPTGRGEDVRCAFRALREAGARPRLLDLHGQYRPDGGAQAEFGDALAREPGRTNVFFINGDEIEGALSKLGGIPRDARNIVYPAWELPVFPEVWRKELARFDEVWAPSVFILRSLDGFAAAPVRLQNLPCEVRLGTMFARKHFGIPDSAYCFLFFFDLRSYAERKNPAAVVEAFRLLLAARPSADVCLAIKMNGSAADAEAAARIRSMASSAGPRVVLIDAAMSDDEVKSLVRCSDCFVSLHRSEGFGRGMAEAMFLGKPVVATAYSGNMDFMTADNSLPVPYDLIAVGEDQYPQWRDQVWADPSASEAAARMASLVDDPAWGRSIGRIARRDVAIKLGYLPTGVRYLEALGVDPTA